MPWDKLIHILLGGLLSAFGGVCIFEIVRMFEQKFRSSMQVRGADSQTPAEGNELPTKYPLMVFLRSYVSPSSLCFIVTTSFIVLNIAFLLMKSPSLVLWLGLTFTILIGIIKLIQMLGIGGIGRAVISYLFEPLR